MVEPSKEDRQQAIASIERCCLQHRDEKIGNTAAGALPGIFVQQNRPGVHHRGVADAQERRLMRVQALDFAVHEDGFTCWRGVDQAKPARR